MNNACRIQASIEFIEDHLKERISIHEIAEQAYFSVFHYQRLFKHHTGFSVMEYMRKRRLACAAFDMITLDRRVIDAAVDYCFSYEQSFIRSFKQEYGMTPNAFRKRKADLVVTEKRILSQAVGERILPTPSLVLNHSRRFLGIKREFDFTGKGKSATTFQIKKEFILHWMSRIARSSPFLYSFIMADPHGGKALFFPAMRVNDVGSVPSGMEELVVPIHWSFTMPQKLDKCILNMTEEDIRLPYQYVHHSFVPAMRNGLRKMDFTYTKMNVNRMSNTSTEYSIHAPVT